MRKLVVAALALPICAAPPAFAETIRLEIKSAQPAFDVRTAEPVVTITLTPDGARAFGRFTAARVGETIHLKAGGKVLSSPKIMDPIFGGSLQISGIETVQAANVLAIAIREGEAAVEIEGSDK